MSATRSVTARRLAAVLAAGTLVGAAAASASADPGHRQHRSQVVISAVQYDSPGVDDRSNRSLNKEWVEVTNNSRQSVNLGGWTLSDEDGHTFTFHRFRLDGRSTVRIHTGTGHDTTTDLYQDRRAYVWDNRSDTATLTNDHGRTIDTYSWGHHRGGRHNH